MAFLAVNWTMPTYEVGQAPSSTRPDLFTSSRRYDG